MNNESTATAAQLEAIYRRAPADYKTTFPDGTRAVLVCRGATCLVPLEQLTPAEVKRLLPQEGA